MNIKKNPLGFGAIAIAVVLLLVCSAAAVVAGSSNAQYKTWTVQNGEVTEQYKVWTAGDTTITQCREIWTVETNPWFNISVERIYQGNQLVAERENLFLKDKSFLDLEYNRNLTARRLCEDANLSQMTMLISGYNETVFTDLLGQNIGTEKPLTFPVYGPGYVKPPF